MNLFDYLQDRLRIVRKSGKDYAICSCPVHKGGLERHPSFSVNLKTGQFRCFSCGIRGGRPDLYALLGPPDSPVEGLVGAEDLLSEFEKGLLGEEEPEQVYISKDILLLFDYCPLDLVRAGFLERTLRRFNIGFDPLYRRITFPIFDHAGNLVAISGRSVDGSEPRYRVYTATMLRNQLLGDPEKYSPNSKSVLWGEHLVPEQETTVILTEGFKACMWVYQAGFPNVVATMGVNVTKQQLHRLTTRFDRVIIAFDRDIPGSRSSQYLQEYLLKKGIPTYVLDYDGTQPDDVNPEYLKEALTNVA